ncbi:MAG: hypothetical protein J2P43_00930 [Candidatus Dormibacteraeota bacterium]|nr:hypothetical protein [Candidatus Dormibacteraeota bacterium]MBO0743550.1 hypothetical protein [Candidatus Dormibacteraeota bacterium]
MAELKRRPRDLTAGEAASHPDEAAELARMAQQVVDEKYRTYEELAGFGGDHFHPPADRVR